MAPEEAAKWLLKGKYANSPSAEPAINAALKAMFRRNGHEARVVAPKDVGDAVYIDASTGHVGLIAHWARGVFEKVARIRKSRRTGNDDSAYDGWRVEVRRVIRFLPWTGLVKAGLRLCNGTDKKRAMQLADNGTFVIDESGDELPVGSSGSTEQDGESSKELLPGYVSDGSGAADCEGGDDWESADNGEDAEYEDTVDYEDVAGGTEGLDYGEGVDDGEALEGGEGAASGELL